MKHALVETAFVSSKNSSKEDLDEVDRIANHPVLRNESRLDFFIQNAEMKRSRSETYTKALLTKPILSQSGSTGKGLDKVPLSFTTYQYRYLNNLPKYHEHSSSGRLGTHSSKSLSPKNNLVKSLSEGTSLKKCATPPPKRLNLLLDSDVIVHPTPPNTTPMRKKMTNISSSFSDTAHHESMDCTAFPKQSIEGKHQNTSAYSSVISSMESIRTDTSEGKDVITNGNVSVGGEVHGILLLMLIRLYLTCISFYRGELL